VLPQLILLRQTNVPTVIDSYYLVLLGSYRALYILNWIVRFADKNERHFDPIAVIFGIIQTVLYADFAWVYYSRQRVKLRAGGIVDSDDLERGFFVGRLVGKKSQDNDEDSAEEGDSVSGGRNRGGRWGARGISVSADEDFDASGEDARPLADPSAFEDESDEEDDHSSKKDSTKPVSREHETEEASAWSETETLGTK
jgi:ER lumen protein retaining receptor